MSVQQEIWTRAEILIQKRGSRSLDEAIAHVLNSDRGLYERYRAEVSTSAPLTKSASAGEPAVDIVKARAQALVRKGGAVDEEAAIAEIFREDPDLYARYRREAATGARTVQVPDARRQEAATIFQRNAESIRKTDETIDSAMSRYSATPAGRYWYDLHRGIDPLPETPPPTAAPAATDTTKIERIGKTVERCIEQIQDMAKGEGVVLPDRVPFRKYTRALTFNEVKALRHSA